MESDVKVFQVYLDYKEAKENVAIQDSLDSKEIKDKWEW